MLLKKSETYFTLSRIELAGGLYHVTSRGDRREDIFLCEADWHVWLEIFGDVCRRFNWACHAWCQMTNHYHVVVETVEGNLSQGMRQLNGVYTQRLNRTHRRVGHVFQGRYRAIMVEKEAYLLELMRYVVLRAGRVAQAGDWPWSSYNAMVGTSLRPDWLQTDWVLEQFGNTRGKAVTAYIDFVNAGMGQPSAWESLRGQIYLGSEAFVNRMQALLADRSAMAEIPRIQRRPLAKPLAYYRDTMADPKAAMAAAYATGDYSMQEIAMFFGVHYATVSRVVKKHEAMMHDCNGLLPNVNFTVAMVFKLRSLKLFAKNAHHAREMSKTVYLRRMPEDTGHLSQQILPRRLLRQCFPSA